ncbi:hypothetical protein ACJJTC_005224 [Scirpophaga incertulas]
MDYVVGNVAALISGNVTPNRPKLMRRALTPTKHQPSPNVTPKSEVAGDRSIFLSPSVQKKKAIVKKSPKRIFQNPDLEVTQNENNVGLSPKAEKVKKNIKSELGLDEEHNKSQSTLKKSKKKKSGENESTDSCETLPKEKLKSLKNLKVDPNSEEIKTEQQQSDMEDSTHVQDTNENSSKLHKKKHKNEVENNNSTEVVTQGSPKKHSKNKKTKSLSEVSKQTIELNQDNVNNDNKVKIKKRMKTANLVNPNAITNKDTDSEHDSDDEIQSENEDVNKEIFKSEMPDESSDEENPSQQKRPEVQVTPEEKFTHDEINRTLFVGNVQFNKKCKKEVKSIFSKYGEIETVRIRTVPVKDARVTPKLAVIKNELHPERTTVNIYIKFKHPSSVEKALVENNRILNERHLRVTRSNTTGAEYDPNCAIFVGNMPFAIEDETLREKFQSCGEIESVRIVRDKKTNAGKGFGYVNFTSKDGVELALAMSEEDLTIKNRILRVKRCINTTKQQNRQNHNNQNGQNHHNPINRNHQNSFRGRGRGQGRNFGNRGFNQKGPNHENTFGAHRRIMNKRQFQSANEGPPEKRPRQFNQPHKEKKPRQEFVGMTAEKKKKNTYNKGQKKKKAISEILTK